MTTNQDRRIALINGAGSPLVRAVALELARSGFGLVISGPAEQLRRLELSSLVAQFGTEVVELPTEEDGSPIKRAYERFGRLDCLVNLQAVQPDLTPEALYEWPKRTLALSLEAAEVLTGGAGYGAIVNQCFLPGVFAGTALEECMPAVKGAVTGITRTLCRKLGDRNISVNCIQTGLMELPELRALESDVVRGLTPPLGRRGRPEDVAKLVAFLAAKNRYWTGQAIVLDGGLTSGTTGT